MPLLCRARLGAILMAAAAAAGCQETKREPAVVDPSEDGVCRVLADRRLQQPLETIAAEFARRTGLRVDLTFLPAPDLEARAASGPAGCCDVVLGMPERKDGRTAVQVLPGAATVAWKYPTGEPVWAAATTGRPGAADFVRFAGNPTGHRLWSESEAGFTIVSGEHAASLEWISGHRVRHTYALTAQRMLAECGGIREGRMIDIGCGPGHLEVELARRSRFEIVGLDIDPGARRFFEQRMREAGLSDRVTFVEGDAQQLPFPDAYADVIVSRGVLAFIPDIGKCLREVRRVLKPEGVAFLGGRYVYTPQPDKVPTEKLREIVRTSGVLDARVIEENGQWVKIAGPKAPESARQPAVPGPALFAGRLVAWYDIEEGRCLLLCGGGGEAAEALQRGFVEASVLEITALYDTEKAAEAARGRVREAGLEKRVTCAAGRLAALPFGDASFDLVAGIGPMLVFEKDRPGALREIYRVLRQGGAARVGGRFEGLPASRRVSSEALRADIEKAGIPSIRVIDDGGQWVEIFKGIR